MKYSALVFTAVAALFIAASPALADPAHAPVPPSLPLLTVPVRADALIIPVTIRGRLYHFLLDTGINTLVVDNLLASELTQREPAEQIPLLYQQILAAGIRSAGGPWISRGFRSGGRWRWALAMRCYLRAPPGWVQISVR